MEERDRIKDVINRVVPSISPIGKDDPTALSTSEGFAYRETGFSQINDIIETGFVRANDKRPSNQVWWTLGGSNSFHVNKKPILVASTNAVQDLRTGAVSINDLVEIWIYDEQSQTWNNKINDIRTMYAQKHPVQEQINHLKKQISVYDSQIKALLTSIQPYMQIPKVNQEISKVIKKNNEINSSQIIDSLNDYKIVVEIKQSVVNYLEQANKFIKENMGKQQETVTPVQGQQTDTQILPNDFWKEFDQPKQEQNQNPPLHNNFWDEFDNPNNRRNREHVRKYNNDGTYTMEYIAHLSNTPSGFNKTIYDQLMQENALKIQQNEQANRKIGNNL